MIRSITFAALALLLAGCASVPEPPTVSGRSRTPVNDAGDQRMLAAMRFPPSGPQVVAYHQPAWHTMVGCYTRTSSYEPALDHASKVRAMLHSGLSRVEIRAKAGRDPIKPDRRMVRCMESAARWLEAEGVPADRIIIDYASSPITAGGESYASRPAARRVDLEFYRSLNQQ